MVPICLDANQVTDLVSRYAAPKKGWEGVYLNYHPTGLGATTKEALINGKPTWLNPQVRAKGRLNYSKGRMGRVYDTESEWIPYEKALGATEKA